MPIDTDSRLEARRKQILEAAITVLLEKGVAHSRMNDFVRASGLSKGGVYHHYQSKEELLVGVMEYFFNQYSQLAMEPFAETGSPYKRLQAMLHSHYQLLNELGDFNQILIDFLAHARHIKPIQQLFREQYAYFQQRLADIIRQGIDTGEFRKDIDPMAIASSFIGVFDGVGLALMVAPDSVRFPDYAVAANMAILEGICAK